MSAKTETLYRDAPFEALVRIDESLVPDCGNGAIARLRAENGRRDRLLWKLTTALWLALSVCVLGLATFRQAPIIILIGFIASRDVIIVMWISRDRAGLAERAIGEIIRLQGIGRIAHEQRLRAHVAAWNAEAAGCATRLAASEWLTRRQRRLLREAHQLRERREALILEIAALRDGFRAAA